MPTLFDVAKKSGVSQATASRVMNKAQGAFPISAGTRARVLDSARKLGYVPNAAAQALRRGRTRTISVIGSTPHFFRISGDPANFHLAAMEGLMRAAIERGYHVNLLCGTETDPELGGAFADIGLTDGLLVINRDLKADSGYIRSLDRAAKPVMYALDYPDGEHVYATAPDDRAGGRLATARLIERGHTKIAFVQQACYAGIFGRRRAGWEEELQARGIEPHASWRLDVEQLTVDALDTAGVTALLCANEQIAFAAKRIVETHGRKVPDDFAVLAFSHEHVGGSGTHLFASVAEPLSEITAAAFRRLVDLAEGRAIERLELFDYRFVEGATL